MDVKNTKLEKAFWSLRYQEERTGWDMGSVSKPLKEYIDQLGHKQLKILIPGAGSAYEAEYLYARGFEDVYVLDLAEEPLRSFTERVPSFPKTQLIQENYFNHLGQYDLILEQTFFCSFPPTKTNRALYAEQSSKLLREGGKLVGLWFDIPLSGDLVKRPFGGSKKEYLEYLAPYFELLTFEACYNSHPARDGNELFGIFRKKSEQ